MTTPEREDQDFWINEMSYHGWDYDHFVFSADDNNFHKQPPSENVHALVQASAFLTNRSDLLAYELCEKYARSPSLTSEEFYGATVLIQELRRSLNSWNQVHQNLLCLDLSEKAQSHTTIQAAQAMRELADQANTTSLQLHCFTIVLRGITNRFLFLANAYTYLFKTAGFGFRQLAEFRVYDMIESRLHLHWGVSTLANRKSDPVLPQEYVEACSSLFGSLSTALDFRIPATTVSPEFNDDEACLKRHIKALAKECSDQLPGINISSQSPRWVPWFAEYWTHKDVIINKFVYPTMPGTLNTDFPDNEL